MNLQVLSNDGSVIILQAGGRISQASLPVEGEPIETLVGQGVYGRCLLLDMKGAEYLDSSGVGWLLRVHKRCREEGGRLILFGIPPVVLQVLRVLKLNLVLSIVDGEEQARSLLDQAGEA